MEKRKEEILSKLTAFNTNKCYKNELLAEMSKLQSEMASLVFGESGRDKKVWDVSRYFCTMAQQSGRVAKETLSEFQEKTTDFRNLFRGEIEGRRGEKRVRYDLLDKLGSRVSIISNLEFTYNGKPVEIDLVVLDEKGITIVEVKNTEKEVYIDCNGVMVVQGHKRSYCKGNLLYCMEFKRKALSAVLNRGGISGIPISCTVVFANFACELKNECKELSVIFTPQLASFIENRSGAASLSRMKISWIMDALKGSSQPNEYTQKFDYAGYKRLFADILCRIENRPEYILHTIPQQDITTARSNNSTQTQKTSKRWDILGKIGLVAGITAVLGLRR